MKLLTLTDGNDFPHYDFDLCAEFNHTNTWFSSNCHDTSHASFIFLQTT